jgi:hypothetical protein
MKKLAAISFCFGCIAAISICRAVDLKQSKVTQVVNDVQIISASDQTKKNAAVNDIFSMPDILRTGAASRAELVAQDETVTRVGANTIFSFDPANRTIDLQQGSLLFHSPHGKGGGTIHTGSATASVLGTTLIVTITQNGGMKVIDLEGEVEVKFLNGLGQSLEPGQMTFILPGGNQLAPIIIFRLDDLTEKSLLVKGFNQPLPSWPLIIQQIEKQIKLIKSGRETDTGLFAGDNANANQVQVLDANTIQSDLNSSGGISALNSDATINQPSLTDASIPTPPNHVFVNSSFKLPGNSFFAGQSFKGFAALDIFFNTPAAELDSLSVNLSPYASAPVFDFVAANDLDIEGSVVFAGFDSAANNTLSLIAGNQISISPNFTVEADVADFELAAPAALTLNGVNLQNSVGNIGLTFGQDISLENNALINAQGNATLKTTAGGIDISDSIVNGSDAVTLTAKQDVTIANSTIAANEIVGSVNITANSGSVSLTDTSIQAFYLTINSGDGILLDSDGTATPQTIKNPNAGPHPSAVEIPSLNLSAATLISANNMDFSSFDIINMAANTINLSDVNLGTGNVTLKSLLGLLNVGSSKSGYVNFIQNVTYNNDLAQNYVNNGGGITVTTLH